MARPKTDKTSSPKATKAATTAPTVASLGDDTNQSAGEPSGPNMTRQEHEALTGSESQEKANPAPTTGEGQRMGEISSCTTLRAAEPSRVVIAATIASGLMAHGRYAALLRDERMIRELVTNALRVADALIAAAEPQA